MWVDVKYMKGVILYSSTWNAASASCSSTKSVLVRG